MLLILIFICREIIDCFGDGFHASKQLQLHNLAGHALRQRRRPPRRRRLRIAAGSLGPASRAAGLVGPLLGPNRVQLRRSRQRPVRDRRLRRRDQVHRRRRAARQLGGVHPRQRRRRSGQGLLRREPRRRVQRRDGGAAVGRRRRLPVRRLRGRPEGQLPEGAAGGGRRWRGGGVQERVRGLQHGGVLLHRRARDAADVLADAVLGDVQGGVPRRLQLRLRRLVEHLHVRRRRLYHLVLPHCLNSTISNLFYLI